MKRVVIGSDHRGYQLKNLLSVKLTDAGDEAIDMGCYDASEKVDYPDYAFPVCEKVASGAADCGILVCGSGLGMSIAANKCHGIRAALCRDVCSAKAAKEHNNANILVLAGDFTSIEEADAILKAWISAEFQGDRHERRIHKVMGKESVG